MPYILAKRSDIPAGLLYIQDLVPNTSQLTPCAFVGQTGYDRIPASDAASLATAGGVITFTGEASGLQAWFLTNVSSGSGVVATGSITTVAKALLLDGETVVITDGTTSTTFTFKCTAGVEVDPDTVEVDVTTAVTAGDVRDALITAINGVSLYNITASIGGAAIVTLTNVDENIAAALRNVAVTDTVAFAGVLATATVTDAAAPLSGAGIVQATGTMTVTTNPMTGAGAGDKVTIGGQDLISAAGARTPGANDFNGSAGSPALIAANMIAAINDPANAFGAIATAADGGPAIVVLKAVPIGILGNAVTLTKTLAVAGEITLSDANLANGHDADYITIGGQTLTSVVGARTPGANDFDGSLVTVGGMADEIAAAINDAANGFAAICTAVSDTIDTVTLTAVPVGVLGNAVTLTKTLTVAGDILISGATFTNGVDAFAVTGMAGATNSIALTAAEALVDVGDVTTLMGYDVVGAAGAINLAAINGALTTGTITEAQVGDILDILAGRYYGAAAGTQVQTAGAFTPSGTYGFDDTLGPIRHYYDTEAFRMSWTEGALFHLRQNTYVYGGVTRAAVAVYDDDGSLYV